MTIPGQQPIDWSAIGRGGGRAVAKPTLIILIVAATLVIGLALSTLALEGSGAWVMRIVAALLAVPVVWLAARRLQVLNLLSEMERTGANPANVVRSRSSDGQVVEVVISDATPQSVGLPKTGVAGLTVLSFASLASAGLSFGLLIIVALTQLF